MGQYQSVDRLFQVAWLQNGRIRRWSKTLARVLGPTSHGLRDVLTGHETRGYSSLCCVAGYLQNWRVVIVVDWKLQLGPGDCVSRPPSLCHKPYKKLTCHLGSVMGLCPILLNMLQFWMIDSIVKASDSLGLTTNALSPPVDESREPLFVNEQDSDGEGEDGPVRRPHVDLEGGYMSPPTNGAAIHSRALSPASAADGKLDNKSTAATTTTTKLDEPGKSRTSIESQSQQPSVRRRASPLLPPHGASAESLTGQGEFEGGYPGWDGEQPGGASAGKRRSPKLSVGKRSLSIGRGGKVSSGGSGSWKLDTISPGHDQVKT